LGYFQKKKDLHFILEKEPYNTTGPLSTNRPKGRGQPRVSCLWSGTMAEPHRRDPGTQSTNKGYLATWARSSFGYARDSRAAYTVNADGVGRAEQRLCTACSPMHRLPRQLFIRTMRTPAASGAPAPEGTALTQNARHIRAPRVNRCSRCRTSRAEALCSLQPDASAARHLFIKYDAHSGASGAPAPERTALTQNDRHSRAPRVNRCSRRRTSRAEALCSLQPHASATPAAIY